MRVFGSVVVGALVLGAVAAPRPARACSFDPRCRLVDPLGPLAAGSPLFVQCVIGVEIGLSITATTGAPVPFETVPWGSSVFEVVLPDLAPGTAVRISSGEPSIEPLETEVLVGESPRLTEPLQVTADLELVEVVPAALCAPALDERLHVRVRHRSSSAPIAVWGLARAGEETSFEAVAPVRATNGGTEALVRLLVPDDDTECFDVLAADFAGRRARLPTVCVPAGCGCATATPGQDTAWVALVIVGLVGYRARRRFG
jgi:MYXO-CTERM domain-containing protein